MTLRSLFRWALLPTTLASSSALVACGASDVGPPLPDVIGTHEDLETANIRRVLDQRYTATDVRHSFRTKFGETIDCIDFFAQSGVKRLAELGHPITELPATPPIDRSALPDFAFNGAPDENGAPRECPAGTVPILRISVDDVKAAGGLAAMLSHARPEQIPMPSTSCPLTPELDQFAHVIEDYPAPSSPSVHITEGLATMNIVQPAVATTPNAQHSLAQVWMTAGCGFFTSDATTTCQGADCIESVETGWDVDPTFLNRSTPTPNAPHFFVYTTNDGYQSACFDGDSALCTSGFTNTWVGAPGAVMTPEMALPPSVLGGAQSELTLLVERASADGNEVWMVEASVGGSDQLAPVGYYPVSAFHNQMQSSADSFQVGGEIHDHTDTMTVPMGTGAAATDGYGSAAYFHDFAVNTQESGIAEGFFVTGVTEPQGAPANYAISTTAPPKPGGNWTDYFYYGEALVPARLSITALRALQAISGGHLITTTALNIGTDGAVYSRLFQNGTWTAASPISASGLAPSSAAVATGAVSSTTTALFVVGSDGKLDVATQTSGGAWSPFTALTAANFAKPGAPLVTGAPTGPLAVFVVDTAGKLESITATSTGGWGAPVALTATGFAPSGASLAAGRRGVDEFDVFMVGPDGTLKYEFYNFGVWGSITLSSSGFAPPGAPMGTALDVHGFFNVMVVGNTGALYTNWDVTPLWSGETALTATGFAPPGAGVSAINLNNQSLNVFFTDTSGNVETMNNGGIGWSAASVIAPSATNPGAAISSVVQGTNELDVFTTTPGSPSGVLESVDIGGTWAPPTPLP